MLLYVQPLLNSAMRIGHIIHGLEANKRLQYRSGTRKIDRLICDTIDLTRILVP